MKNKAVFIHSLFRTGSTYLWSKFRRNPDFVCYYEPLHPALRSLSLEKPFVWDSSLETTDLMHHPPLKENKHAEYQGLLRPGHDGVPFFKKSFSYDEYCENGENAGLKRYVDFLIENAGDKRAVFKFNRSSLRTRWFKKKYPTCLHLYLFRNPRDQWESYNSMSRNGLRDLFIATDILIASINQTSRYFKPLAEIVPLVPFHAETAEDEITVYQGLLDAYSQNERYLVFYYIWLVSLIENLLHSDLVININLLTSTPPYRDRISAGLASFQVDGISFDDADAKPHPLCTLPSGDQEDIEREVQAVVAGFIGQGDLGRALERLQAEEALGLGLGQGLKPRLGRGPQPDGGPPLRLNSESVLVQMIQALGSSLVLRFHDVKRLKTELEKSQALLNEQGVTIRKLETELSDKTRQFSEMEKVLSDVLGSYTFMIGRILLWPLRFIDGLMASLRDRSGHR